MLVLEQHTTKKEQIDENMTDLAAGNKDSKEYKIKVSWDNTVYAKELKDYLLGLYYLVA